MSEFKNFTPEANRETHGEIKNALADAVRKKSGKDRVELLKKLIGDGGKEATVMTQNDGYQLRLRESENENQSGEENHALKKGAKVTIIDADYRNRDDNSGQKWLAEKEHLFFRVRVDLADTKHGNENGIAPGTKYAEGWVSSEYLQVWNKESKTDKKKEKKTGDGSGKPDKKSDSGKDGKGKPDKKEDAGSDGDGKPDKKTDTGKDGDGKPDKKKYAESAPVKPEPKKTESAPVKPEPKKTESAPVKPEPKKTESAPVKPEPKKTESAPVKPEPKKTESAPVKPEPKKTESAPVKPEPKKTESAPVKPEPKKTESAPVKPEPKKTESAPVKPEPKKTESAPVKPEPKKTESAPVKPEPKKTESAPVKPEPKKTESAPVKPEPKKTESAPVKPEPKKTESAPVKPEVTSTDPGENSEDPSTWTGDFLVKKQPDFVFEGEFAGIPEKRPQPVNASKPPENKVIEQKAIIFTPEQIQNGKFITPDGYPSDIPPGTRGIEWEKTADWSRMIYLTSQADIEKHTGGIPDLPVELLKQQWKNWVLEQEGKEIAKVEDGKLFIHQENWDREELQSDKIYFWETLKFLADPEKYNIATDRELINSISETAYLRNDPDLIKSTTKQILEKADIAMTGDAVKNLYRGYVEFRWNDILVNFGGDKIVISDKKIIEPGNGKAILTISDEWGAKLDYRS